MSDVIQRLHRERAALEVKTDKLCKFIASPRHSELPDFQREMLVAQYHAMQSYLHILKLRISDLMTPERGGQLVNIQQRLTGALRQYRHNNDNTDPAHKPEHGFVFGYDKAEIDSLAAEARQIIETLVEYAECNDPGNPHLGRAKGFLSGGGSDV